MGGDWRSPEPPAGHPSANGREARRGGGRVLPDRTVIQDALERRPRSASLLRPQRQIGRKLAIGLALLSGGVVGGLVLGLSLRPGAPVQQQHWAQAPAVAAAPGAASLNVAPPPSPVPPASSVAASNQGGLPKSAWPPEGTDARPARSAPVPSATDAEVLRKSLAAEQARLEALARARAAAESQLAQLQEQVAQREQATQREILARREAALASLPSVTSPLPAPSPRPPRTESASGAGSGAAPSGTVSNPAAGQQRVVLHHRAGSYAAAEAAGAMAAQVREAGFDLGDTRAVTATPSQRVVRYFHAEDAPAAARLAGRLGRGWALQDFRSYEPLPSPGLLEVWLPDR